MSGTVRLYTAQTETVRGIIERDGVAYVKRANVADKYAESAGSFLEAYRWLAGEAPRYVKQPPEAELLYWAFPQKESIALEEKRENLLVLDVPVTEALFFLEEEWTRILRFELLSDDPAAARAFSKELKLRGVTAYRAMMTPFYPDIRQALTESWQRLFRFDGACKRGEPLPGRMQCALWCIKREWIAETDS